MQSQRDQAFEIKRVHEALALPAGTQRLLIKNDFGTVYVKKLKDPASLGVHAVVQVAPGVRMPQFLVQPGDRPGSAQLLVRPAPGDKAPIRVDLAAYLPPMYEITVETSSGDVFAKNVRSDLAVRTVGGNIVATSAGRLQLHTVDGVIRATQIGGKWQGDASVRSEHGLVELSIPDDSPARLQVTALGGLQTDLPSLKPIGGHQDQWQGALNAEGALLSLTIYAGGEAIVRRSIQE
ncbi:hypothetical protein C7S18_21270 [Ahniella affigens]|uniref:Adhesin domain-containing protein n=1 Tax=Ahniella affigens TaxID=2021234 RepID=A0A2P1PXH0_9GAMM|nr:hypothetical protein [Ahniella affigens]AVP99548.1 hypothetical protein C7S18_21270 [Ahniella affigens]